MDRLDTISTTTTWGSATSRPQLRHKPAFRCLKTVASNQRLVIETDHTGGKIDTRGIAVETEDTTTTTDQTTTNPTPPPQPETTTGGYPGWYAGSTFHGPAMMWSNGVATACPMGMFGMYPYPPYYPMMYPYVPYMPSFMYFYNHHG
ncbi:hypothetical protein CONLIGDRAFT_677907 [Coniochaeta ligniaria NRRL 30616]|uniref:Uncharacterized protein n=1 Tax=Coniochaeta ligniaria NRRL 30616 TaxID=1408157 RepID=A0A1J7J290_9PEZI|nr:hypothetical protein CONLIGDRAFT_677907 [Coniochaeta ligniaria NRRL 30616]